MLLNRVFGMENKEGIKVVMLKKNFFPESKGVYRRKTSNISVNIPQSTTKYSLMNILRIGNRIK